MIHARAYSGFFEPLSWDIVYDIFERAVRDDPPSIKSLRACNSDFYFFCRANNVARHAKFKKFSTRIISMDDNELDRLERRADIGSPLAQLAYGAHCFFNLNNRIVGDFMIYASADEEGHTGRYVQSLVDIVKGEQDGFRAFDRLFNEEAHSLDRVNLRKSRMFLRGILKYDSYEIFGIRRHRLCHRRGVMHWDGRMQSICLLRENNIKCSTCGLELELYKLRYGLI